MPGAARWIPQDDRLEGFKRLNRQYLTPLGLAARDLVRNVVYKMRSRRRKWAGYTTHYTYTTRRFTCTVNTESSDGVDSASEEAPEPPSKLSPFAAIAVPHSPKMYMVNTPGKVLPWPSSPQSSSPSPLYHECSHSYSSEIAPRWPSPQPPDHWDPTPTNHIRGWNRYSRRLELCLPTPEPRSETPDSMVLPTNIAYSASSQASTRPPSTSTCASQNLRRLPSIESSFGPVFDLNQFRREWFRVGEFEPGNYRQSICSDTLESIPEDQLINSQTSDDNLAPASSHRTLSSMASSAWSPRNSARYISYHR